MPASPITVYDLGVQPYEGVWRLQERLVMARYGQTWDHDALLLVEHPHVFTLGRRASTSHLLDPRDERGQAIPTFDVNRGGDITYHGPGQLVGYPIFHLASRGNDVIAFLRSIENALIATCRRFSIPAQHRRGYTGVWTDGSKIASIGIGVQRGFTLHGFGLNVHPEMEYFDRIVPCGIQGVEMTSLSLAGKRPIQMQETKQAVAKSFSEIFDSPCSWGKSQDLP